MKAKVCACLLALVMVLGLLPVAGAEGTNQVIYGGGSVLYNAAGSVVDNGELGDGNAVVRMTKRIEQHKDDNDQPVENEFVVTLQVETSQDITEIASDTPDSAVLLVMDVSNSMDDCIHCGEEASHGNHSGTSTTTYYCPNNSRDTYQPGRRGRCSNCGYNQSYHRAETTHTGGTCGYQARLAATKVAAKDFLHEFAYETGAQDGDKRMVAIVAYGTHAVTVRDWVDITSTEGMYAVEQAIDGLTLANNNQSQQSGLRGGGTSIESGLALGRNLLGQSAVGDIDYRYTILLTDGQPTYPASNANSTRTDYVSGSTGNNGSSTQEADMDNVAAIAQSIRNMSKLYSVCFGKVDGDDVWNLTPFENWSGSNPDWSTNDNTTIGSWLSSFSTAAYRADDASSAELFDTFSSILAQIQVAARAWKVEDWLGAHMVYGQPVSVSNGRGGYVANRVSAPDAEDYTTHENGVPAFVWDLLRSENDPAITDWNASTETGVLGYTYKYRVTLDNLDSRYSTQDTNNDGWGDGDETKPSNAITNANTLATLRYATTDENGNWPDNTDEYKTAVFPVPTVQGLVGSFTFTKMVQNPSGEDTTTPQALAGIEFRLRSADSAANPNDATLWTYVDATSDEYGVVTFTGIPSGHKYTLLEAEQNDHYVDLGDIPVEISWGTAIDTENKFEKQTGGSQILYNTYEENVLGQITLQKSFAANSVKPHSIQFKITGKEGTEAEGYSAQRSLYASDALEDDSNTWSWTLRGLRIGGYTIEEVNALDIHGNKLRDTHDLSYEIYVDGAQQPSKSGSFVEGTTDTYPKLDVALSDTDADRLVTVKFVNNMTPKQGTLNISKSFVDLPASMVNANMNLSMKVIATPVDASGAGISGEVPVEITLAWDGDRNAYYASASLPIGRYKLTEEITGTVPGYSLLHYVFEANSSSFENGIVTINDDTTLNVTLKNHYQQDTAHMHIIKKFEGDLTAEDFEDRVIYVNIYQTANGQKVGEPVAAVQLDEGDGAWTAATPELPLGDYWLEEIVNEGAAGTAFTAGYTHEVSWNPGQLVQLTAKNQAVNITLTNKYSQDTGFINVTKNFAQDSDLNGNYFEDNSKQITITIYKAGDTTKTPVDTLTLPVNANGQWSWTDTSIALPVGDYVLEESGHLVDGYTLSQTWTGVNAGTTDVVTVVNGNTAAIGLENKYTQDKGSLTVSKTFADIPDTISNDLSVRISITDTTNPANTYTITLPKTSANSNEKIWTDTIELPVGVYQLNEAVSDAEGYTLSKAEWTGLTADNTVTITKDAAAPVTVSVQNTYTDDYGYLTINKVLTGLETQDNEFTFKITSEDNIESVAVVTVGSNGRGSTIVNLPVGKYTVEELISSTEDSRYKISYAFESNGVVINDSSVAVDVTSGAQLSFTCTNTNLPRLSVKVPLEKTVKVTGNTVPDQTTFSFGAEWSNPAHLPIDVDFVNEDGNTIGEVKKTATNAYTITVNGEGTVKGYIVIRGFADDLNGFELTTWEKLNPYGNVQAMKDAHWNYDQTAQNSSLRWKVTFNKVDDHSVSYDIALGQEDGKSRIAFENVYEEVDVPELPATGDEDMPLLWALLIVLSAGGLVLLRKKFAR